MRNEKTNVRRTRVFGLAAVTGSRAVRSTLIIAVLLGSVLLVVAARAYNKSSFNVASVTAELFPASTKPNLNTPQSQGSVKKGTEVEVITILPTGFQPAEISRPTGFFLIAVENRSGLRTIQLRLDREAGNRLHEVQVHPRKNYWHQGLDLPPGRYILSEAYHPEWTCAIEIQSR